MQSHVSTPPGTAPSLDCASNTSVTPRCRGVNNVALQSAAETAVDQLLAVQARDIARFQAAIRAAHEVFLRLHLPLGSPCDGWDRSDIDATLLEWMRGRDSLALMEIAEDRLLERSLST